MGKGAPAKITRWHDYTSVLVANPLDKANTVPSAWRYYCGALGYWLPHGLNQAVRYGQQMRLLR